MANPTAALQALGNVASFVANLMTGALGGAVQLTTGYLNFLGSSLSAVAQGTTTAGGALVSQFSGLITGIAAVNDIIGVATDGLSVVIGQMVSAVSALDPGLIDQFNTILAGVSATIGQAFLGSISQMINFIQKFSDMIAPIIEQLSPVMDQLTEAVLSLATVLLSALMPVIQMMVPIMQAQIEVIKVIGKVLEAIGPALGAIIQLFLVPMTIISAILKSAIPVLNLLVPVVKAIGDALVWLVNRIIDLVNKLPGINIEKFDATPHLGHGLAANKQNATIKDLQAFSKDIVVQAFQSSLGGKSDKQKQLDLLEKIEKNTARPAGSDIGRAEPAGDPRRTSWDPWRIHRPADLAAEEA